MGETQDRQNNVRRTNGQITRSVADERPGMERSPIYAINWKDGGQPSRFSTRPTLHTSARYRPRVNRSMVAGQSSRRRFGRKASAETSGQFVPKESEVSVIPDGRRYGSGIKGFGRIMKAVGARMFADMTGEQPQARRHNRRNHGIIRGATAEHAA